MAKMQARKDDSARRRTAKPSVSQLAVLIQSALSSSTRLVTSESPVIQPEYQHYL